MSTKAGKIWGQTELLHANGVLEFHRIEAVAGGKCSKHKHKYKWNGFFVESGHLIIRVWKNDYDLVDVTHLYAGDFMQVKPGEFHQFEAVEDTIAFELYWAEFDHNDIEREDVGEVTTNKPQHSIAKIKCAQPDCDDEAVDISNYCNNHKPQHW